MGMFCIFIFFPFLASYTNLIYCQSCLQKLRVGNFNLDEILLIAFPMAGTINFLGLNLGHYVVCQSVNTSVLLKIKVFGQV